MKTRIELGVVRFQVTVRNNGKLTDIKLLNRSAGITDEAVVLCKEAILEASPLSAFPAALINKEDVSFFMSFGY